MEDNLKYKTIENKCTGEFRDRGSKFFAYAYPIKTVDEVKERVKALKKEHPKAVHHCLAFRIGTDGTLYRANDDGEPSGSAGRPILGQIDSAELTNIAVIVVRYFGGSLLGVPGLINAYKTATEEALKNAVVTEHWIEKDIELSFDYPQIGEVLHLLKQYEATIHKQELQLFCEVNAGIPLMNYEQAVEKFTDMQGVKLKTAEGE